MTSKKTLEYCAPEVKEIMLSNEGLICGSPTFGDPKHPGADMEEDDDYTYDY